MKDNAITGTLAKKADIYAIETLGIPSLELMENASSKVADYILKNFSGSCINVISGTGNNGADGVCIAKILLNNEQFKGSIEVYITSNIDHATPEFSHQLSAYKKTGGALHLITSSDELPSTGVLIDAVFGIGLQTRLRDDKAELLNALDKKHFEHVIAVDVPSGINSDTGELLGAGIHADTTITFGRIKTGLINNDGKEYSGRILTEDIGIPDEAYDNVLS